MDPKATKATLTISLADLEIIIKRAVREAVREELARLLRAPARSRTEVWEHEEPDDSEGDEELLTDALALSQ